MPSDRNLLHNLLMFGKNYLEAGVACWMQAYTQSNFNRRLQTMKEAAGILAQGRENVSSRYLR